MDSELFRFRFCALLLCPLSLISQENHNHTAPEKLGSVSFPISCAPGVQQEFNRGIALLHSFAYNAAESTFRGVEEQDPHCAIAHWGIAMTHFHELWDPPLAVSTIPIGQAEIRQAQALGGSSERERRFIDALACIFERTSTVPYAARALQHERAMCDLSAEDRKDVEAQVFCALALLSNASPLDKSHARQKKAAEILEPLSHIYPQHPGIFHYLIHAYDNAELAPGGLSAAKAYSRLAPSAPHALHMPSHIFTRLGLWNDSIASNIAARNAAGQQREISQNYANGHHWYAEFLTLAGRDGEAIAESERARELDPLSAIINTWVGSRYFFARQYDRAIEQYRHALEMDSAFVPGHLVLGHALEQKGQYPEAILEFEKAVRLSGDSPVYLASLAHAYGAAGRQSEARKTLDDLTKLSRRKYVSSYDLALVYLGSGATDQALQLLARAVDERCPRAMFLGVDPRFDNLRSDPRFKRLAFKVAPPS